LLGSKKLSEDDAINVQEWLLDPGADVVVADEAHTIKNDKSKIGGLLNRIRTKSRIATTGSPLSNNLKEYWTMMNWIHRDFLGTLRSFTAEYIVPIQAGLYAESSLEERKLSQRRLVSLKTVLNGKLHRQDISAIQADLPSKSEFIVHLPLSPLQQQLYDALLNSGFERHTQLFKWINILRLICNHPYTLWVTSPFDTFANHSITSEKQGRNKQRMKTKSKNAERMQVDQ
jgi:SNF2 family DNA or RNA helicase